MSLKLIWFVSEISVEPKSPVETMTLQQLTIFQAVARTLSITKAAGELRISQPSISKQLRLLEEKYGVKFHLRVGQGIKLTPEGRLFWQAAQPVLEKIENLKELFTRGEYAGGFTIGASQSPSASLATSVLEAFRRRYPKVSTLLRTANSGTLEQLVRGREIEIALVTAPSDHPDIIVEPIHSQQVCAFVSFRHPLAAKGKLDADELRETPFIIKMAGRIEKLLKQKRCNLNIAMQCESSGAVKSAVESGLGVGLLPRDNVAQGLKAGYYKAVRIADLKNFEFKQFVIYRKGAPLSQNAQDFLALLRQWPQSSVAAKRKRKPMERTRRQPRRFRTDD